MVLPNGKRGEGSAGTLGGDGGQRSRKGGRHRPEKGRAGGAADGHSGGRCEPPRRQAPPVSALTELRRPPGSGTRAGSAGLTSGVRSGGFFFRACLAPGSTGEFMVAAPAPSSPASPQRTRQPIHPTQEVRTPSPAREKLRTAAGTRLKQTSLRNTRPGSQPTRDWPEKRARRRGEDKCACAARAHKRAPKGVTPR